MREIDKSIRAMRRYKNMLVMPNPLVRETAKKGLRLIGQYNAINQHIISPEADLRCRTVCEHLLELYRRTIPQAVAQEEAFAGAITGKGKFDERLNRIFE